MVLQSLILTPNCPPRHMKPINDPMHKSIVHHPKNVVISRRSNVESIMVVVEQSCLNDLFNGEQQSLNPKFSEMELPKKLSFWFFWFKGMQP